VVKYSIDLPDAVDAIIQKQPDPQKFFEEQIAFPLKKAIIKLDNLNNQLEMKALGIGDIGTAELASIRLAAADVAEEAYLKP